jgi:hypothetical protein
VGASLLAKAAYKTPPHSMNLKKLNCAPIEPHANINKIHRLKRNKIPQKPAFRVFLSIFFDCLPSFPLAVRVEGMKTSHTLIQLRQHRSLCLVSARLPG